MKKRNYFCWFRNDRGCWFFPYRPTGRLYSIAANFFPSWIGY